MVDFAIHPNVYVIDDNGTKYTDLSELNEYNETFQRGNYFYIVFTIKNDFITFTYKINATFCTQKHRSKNGSQHAGYDLAVQMNDIWNGKPFQNIRFPTDSKYNNISFIRIEHNQIIFDQNVTSNSGHDTNMIIRLPYDEDMKWIMKSIAYFFTFIDFKDEEDEED